MTFTHTTAVPICSLLSTTVCEISGHRIHQLLTCYSRYFFLLGCVIYETTFIHTFKLALIFASLYKMRGRLETYSHLELVEHGCLVYKLVLLFILWTGMLKWEYDFGGACHTSKRGWWYDALLCSTCVELVCVTGGNDRKDQIGTWDFVNMINLT